MRWVAGGNDRRRAGMIDDVRHIQNGRHITVSIILHDESHVAHKAIASIFSRLVM
jgi:hypothetical protein